MLRKLIGGLTGWAKVIYDPQALELCEKIAIGLDLKGSMNIQMRLTECGPRVFEINPRFSSTVLMRHRVGFSDVLWAVSEAEGKPIHYPHIQGEIQMARTQGAIILNKVSSVKK
jgi:carbamoyl-phosphate synthase large subunit